MPASVGGPMPEGVQLCPKAHFGYMVSGKMKVMMDTGEEKVIGAGDVSGACECRMAVHGWYMFVRILVYALTLTFAS